MAMNNILGLFAQSPLKPLKQLSVKVTECSELLEPFFEASFNHDWDKAEEVRNQIIDLERRADSLKREIRLKLPRGLFLPVERTDLLEIVTQLDKLANYSRDISGRIWVSIWLYQKSCNLLSVNSFSAVSILVAKSAKY